MHLSGFVDADNVGMPQAAGRAGLGVEAANVVGRREATRKDHLERYGPVEGGLMGTVHDSHPAPADLSQQLIFSERLGLGLLRAAGLIRGRPVARTSFRRKS